MLNLMQLKPGQTLRLKNGALATIVENMGDGIWLQLRFVSAPAGGPQPGDEELVHCEEIAGLGEDA